MTSLRRLVGRAAVWAAGVMLVVAGAGRTTAALEDEVRAYEAQDAAQPPPAGATLFVGSSSIRAWTNLAASFPGRPVLNRGFGGSQMSDLLHYFDRLVVPYRPPLMVVYEGDNDLAGGKTVAQVFQDYQAFANRVEQRLPGTEVVFLAVKPSPSRSFLMPQMVEFNGMLESFCAANSHFRFVDTYSPMLDAQGQPRPELFQGDLLHMVAAGYSLWSSLIAPVLDTAPFLPSRHVLIDFGTAASPVVAGPWPAEPVNAWNSVAADWGTTPGASVENLMAIDGTPTSIDLILTQPFAGANEAGATTSLLYPTAAARDSLFGHAGEFQGRPGTLPEFRLTGLAASAAYRLTFFASRTGVVDNRETVYTVTGKLVSSATLDCANNQERLAIVEDVESDANGGIAIALTPGLANTTAERFVYLGVLKIEERPAPAVLEFAEQPADAEVETGQPAEFKAVVTGARPISVQWFLDDEAIPGATELSFRIPEVTADRHGQQFSVRVTNARSEIISRNALLQVRPDTTPPAPLAASTTDGVRVIVVFSEPLDPASVTAAENFRIRGGLVPVLSANLQADARTVELSLVHRVGGPIEVSIAGVRDRAGNEVSAGAGLAFQAPDPEPPTILFDFGAGGSPTLHGAAAGQDPVFWWNNVTSVGLSQSGRLDGLIAADGQSTNLSLLMLSRFNGANENGTTETAPFAANAVRDSLFGNTESFNGMSQVFPSFKLTGLNPSLPYDLTFYASRMGVSDNRETGYTVTGATSGFAALNVANNRGATADVIGIKPTDSGEILISLAPTQANTNSNHFTYLGVLQLRVVEPLQIYAPRRLTDSLMVLDWTGRGRLEWTTDLESSLWNPIIPAPVPPWFEEISESPQRFYRLMPLPPAMGGQ